MERYRVLIKGNAEQVMDELRSRHLEFSDVAASMHNDNYYAIVRADHSDLVNWFTADRGIHAPYPIGTLLWYREFPEDPSD